MEPVYKSVIPGGQIHCVDWSTLNFLAISVSILDDGYVGSGFGSSKTHQLLVLDIDRPWEYHCVYGDNKSVTIEIKWSLDGARLLSVEEDNVARMWTMKGNCINSWIRNHRIPLQDGNGLLYCHWIEHKPLPTVNCNKKVWPELLEYQSYNSSFNMISSEAVIFVYNTGKVQIVSFQGTNVISNEVQLDVDGNLCTGRIITSSSGVILCAVGCNDGQIKLFLLNLVPMSEDTLSVNVTLATSFHPTGGGGGQLTDLVVHPDVNGCVLHICYDNINLLQWSLRDASQSGSYMVKREGLHIMPRPVTSIQCTSLCLRSCDTSPDSAATTPAASADFLLEVEGVVANKWPMELMIMVHDDSSVTILTRSSCQTLFSGKIFVNEKEDFEPATKKPRMDPGGTTKMCLSPNGCCVIFTNGSIISLYTLCPFVLGEKDFSPSPDISRWSVLLAMGAVQQQTVWDICCMCSRVAAHCGDGDLIKKVISQWKTDFNDNADLWKSHLLPIQYRIISLLYKCHEEGLLHSLDHRDYAHLVSSCTLLYLSLPTNNSMDISLYDSLREACSSHGNEEDIDVVLKSCDIKQFVVSSDVASQCQGHVHWIIGFAISIMSKMASCKYARLPDAYIMESLRCIILLIYIWNKCLPHPIIPINDSAMGLVFKVITFAKNHPGTPLDEATNSDVDKHITVEKDSLTLSLTKAANLRGFLHGLSTAKDLPEVFIKEQPPRLRPHVQKHYHASDPFSPLGLVVPKGLIPPWKDIFIEGQRDIIYGGVLARAVLVDTQIKQCSGCRCWSLSFDSRHNAPVDHQTPSPSSDPVYQWRYNWSKYCLCGSCWIIHNRI